MNVTEILEHVKKKVANGILTIEEVERAINREMSLKNVDHSVARYTSRKEFLDKLKELVDSVLVKNKDGEYMYSGMQSLQGLHKKFKEIMREYTGFGGLSRTSVWRVKKQINEYIEMRVPDKDYDGDYRIRQVIKFVRNSMYI